MNIKSIITLSIALGTATLAQAQVNVDFTTTTGWSDEGPGNISHTINGSGESVFAPTTSDLGFRVFDLGTGIADGTSDFIEFDFYLPSGSSFDHWFGFTDLSTTDSWANSFGNMEAYFGIRTGLVGGTGNDINARNGDSSANFDTNLAFDTWHTARIEVNNTSDTYNVLINGSTLASNFGFRNGAATNDLVSFAVFSNTANGASSSDLISVIPEPSTYAMIAGLLTLGLGMVRRRLRQ